MARGAAVSWALLLGRAWLFVSAPAGVTTGETGYTGREVIALGFKKYFQVNLFENIIMKSVDMKLSLAQLLQAAGCREMFTNIHLSHFNLSKQ